MRVQSTDSRGVPLTHFPPLPSSRGRLKSFFSIKGLLAMSSTRQIVVRLALYFHLFSVPHPTIALYGSEILESPHTATSGLSDEHDATAAVSTIGKSKIQHPSLICRRYLGGCLTRGSHSSGVTETSAERNKAKSVAVLRFEKNFIDSYTDQNLSLQDKETEGEGHVDHTRGTR